MSGREVALDLPSVILPDVGNEATQASASPA